MISIVVCKEFQNRYIGRKAVVAILSRAAKIGLKQVDVEIYDFNKQSIKMFSDIGFQKIDKVR
ncbi:GNAT family N-acetyltransferase [Lutispora thermophila]|nr:GNAT family N-acetyltransferase [Lutispora thermophila]